MHRASFLLILFVFSVCLIVGCNPGQDIPAGDRTGSTSADNSKLVMSEPLAAPAGQTGSYTLMQPGETGIDFDNKVTDSVEIPATVAAWPGIAAGDIDQDSDVDIFFSGYDLPSRLYRNDGNLGFTDISEESGVGFDDAGLIPNGAVFADIDGDSDLDLYVCYRNGQNRLYVNDGLGVFADEADARGVASGSSSIMASVFDADQDGDLDYYVCNYHLDVRLRLPPELQEKYRGKMNFVRNEEGTLDLPPDLAKYCEGDSRGKIMAKPESDTLYLNDGTGHFTDGTNAAGLLHHGFNLQALVSDFNNDNLPDILVSGDLHSPDRYFINLGAGRFSNRSKEMLRTTSYSSMGSDAGDINGDGLIDAFVGEMSPVEYKDGKKQSGDMYAFRWDLINLKPQQNMRNALYLNRGDGWMTEAAQLASVKSSDWSWTCRIADLDCSGIPELFVTNGYISRHHEVDNSIILSQLRRNRASEEEVLQFRLQIGSWLTDNIIFTASDHLNYSKAEDNWGMHDNAIGSGAVVSDLDGDGDLDIVVNNTNSMAGVWRNDLTVGNRVLIDLRQAGSNTEGVGSRIWAYCGDEVFTQDVILARGFASGATSRIHLGLGRHALIDRLEIRWPDGRLQEIEGLAVNNHHTIQRADKLADWTSDKPVPLFNQTDIDWEQRELDTLEAEFEAEPLLPFQRSMLGTGAGVADFNLDGRLDLYLAGPAGQAGQLMSGDSAGGFSPDPGMDGLIPTAAEEMGVLWFDANSDSRPDLLITCGGVEQPYGSRLHQDRLFINSETGFSEQKLPQLYLPTAAAAAADIDGDGDLDLALCSRAWPGAYMKTAPSTILQNDGNGKFNQNLALAPGIETAGVISDAQFADLNGDGRQDLVLAEEFGNIQLWINEDGSLVQDTVSPSGMWNSLGIADFDNDGDLDILAGNWGLNTKYHPKPGQPVTLVADDFDGNGQRDLIEVKYGDDCLLPARGRSCSGYAIDYIPAKWPTWSGFADATFEEIYGPIEDAAEQFYAETLETMLLLNDGTGKFSAGNLPLSAQYSAVFGIATGDYNCDGNLDVCLANNFSGPQPETGRWINGYGAVLLGSRDGGFTGLEPDESGMLLYQDARGAVAADLNNDSRLDLVVSVSDGTPQLLSYSKPDSGRGLLVSLVGNSTNSAAVGAKLLLELSDGRILRRDLQAGQGYLSSYLGPIHFGIPENVNPVKLIVHWPDGQESVIAEGLDESLIEVSQP